MIWMFIIYHGHTLIYIKEQNQKQSKLLIVFQQTLKDVEHIYRDIAGFDMCYDEFKEECREA